MRRILTIAALVPLAMLADMSVAHAVTLRLPDGTERPQPYQRWANLAAAPTPLGTVLLKLERCPTGGSLCADPANATIYLEPGPPGAITRIDVLHELGHIFDHEELSDRERQRFSRSIHAEAGWDDYSHTDGPYATAETFATAYSICARWGHRADIWDLAVGVSYDYTPSVRHHRRICRFIEGTALSGGLKRLLGRRDTRRLVAP